MKNNQHALPHHGQETIRAEAEISAKDFRNFKSFLNIIKSDFTDFCLVGGAFRARSNNYQCIVETGFPFFSDMNFDITNIKQFTGLISKFDKKNSITVKVNNSSIIFEDNAGPIELSRVNPAYLDNKFVSEKEMIETVLYNVDPTKVDQIKLIVSDAIPKIEVCRINKLALKLSTESICLKHDKDNLNKGFLSIVNASGDSESRIELKKPLLIPMKKNHYINLKVLPTLFNKDHMYLKCYFTNDQKIFVMYSTKVNDLFVNIYSQSELIEESEEDLIEESEEGLIEESEEG